MGGGAYIFRYVPDYITESSLEVSLLLTLFNFDQDVEM